ncbi:Mce family protein MceA [Nocardia nova SH22a]|uniref:Mce family protein MceA n=2 Tax=Nocardia nova TaxID=37330 RepID=W5TMK2_9NOCA|nr:Mce family protein MceA [Nocardia nova SH22a]
MSGTPLRRRGAVAIGAVVIAVAAATGFTVDHYTDRPPQHRLHITLRTEQLGEGIITGTDVRLDGVVVGSVDAIASLDRGRQLLTLDLDRNQLGGATDDLDVAYAPSNLFGISTVVLKQAGPGAPLRDGSILDMTGDRASRVRDETLSRLVRMLTETSVRVLTPQLTQLITQFGSDLQQFTPFLQSITVLATTAADTLRFLPSLLIDRYGSFAGGLGQFSSSTLQLLQAILHIPIFNTDHERFDATINMLADQALPGIAKTTDVSRTYFHGYTEMYTPTLQALANTVPTPAASHDQLAELLNRLDRIFRDTPQGPALDVQVVLRGLPGLSVPLFGASVAAQGGAR